MDRNDWTNEQRREAEEKYDNLWVPLYEEKWGVYGDATHQQFVRRLLQRLPEPSTVLDAACGAGRYMPMPLEKGHIVVGIDQAQGMLAQAKAKFPTVRTEKIGLQEMNYAEMFEGAICMDALEHVCPEDWPLILRNFHQALKPDGHLYFTVEIADEQDIEIAFRQEMRPPIACGEWINDEAYHYYPSMSQVKEWLLQAGLELLEEGEGDGYYHFVTRKAE